ncbi:MAG: hypothetical protein H6815_06920 [Phycisphaeraceae bacterium]|nr:hypothetical protein [Phycisphaerales bacterium]MCB9860171.1 hypothetical protein [Phycisphaeraceae bacterium]
MPPLPTIRTPVLAELVKELRFAPRATLMRQLANAEALAPDIEDDREYPDEWLIFKVTGYRPEHHSGEIRNCLGADVLHDLSALCEHLSKAAKIRCDDVSPSPIGLDELASRWNVSRKTIERLRRKGLTARRVLDEKDRSVLMFLPSVVDRFEQQHASLLTDAKAFSRFNDNCRTEIFEKAKQLHASHGVSLNTAAKSIAEELKRSHEGIRQLLLRNEETENAIFQNGWHSPDRRRQIAYRAWSMGIPVRNIAAHFRRTSTSIHRLILVERAERLKTVDLHLDAKKKPDAAANLAHVSLPGLGSAPSTDLALLLAQARATDPPKASNEKTVTTLHTQLMISATGVIASLSTTRPKAESVDEAETLLRAIARVRALLVSMELGLALATLDQQFEQNIVSLPVSLLKPMTLQVIHTVAHAVATHNPSRGGRLAAPIGLAITRLAKEWTQRIPAADASKAQRALSTGTSINDWTRSICPWQAWLEPDPRVRMVVDLKPAERKGLSDERATLLRDRYGWAGSLPQTAAALAASRTTLSHHIVRTLTRAEQQALQIARETSDC